MPPFPSYTRGCLNARVSLHDHLRKRHDPLPISSFWPASSFDSHHPPDYFSSKFKLILPFANQANTLSYPNAVDSIFLFIKTLLPFDRFWIPFFSMPAICSFLFHSFSPEARTFDHQSYPIPHRANGRKGLTPATTTRVHRAVIGTSNYLPSRCRAGRKIFRPQDSP